MRWPLVVLGSLASGVLTVFLSLALLLLSVSIYVYFLGVASNQSIGWDPVSLLGHSWKAGAIGILVLIFAIGCLFGFRFLQKRTSRHSG